MKKSWTDCWLLYPTIREMPEQAITILSDWNGSVTDSAVRELETGLTGLYHCKIRVSTPSDGRSDSSCTTTSDVSSDSACMTASDTPAGRFSGDASVHLVKDTALPPEGFQIHAQNGRCVIRSGGESGILYGVFSLLRYLQMEQCAISELSLETTSVPDNSLRVMVHWDNLPGDIERGYSGNSLFFENNTILVNERTVDYARLASSVGINAVVINNSNVKDAALDLISERYYGPLQSLMNVFLNYGIRMFIAVDFTMPLLSGDLSTADPGDPAVRAWWAKKAAEVWKNLPGLGGFVVKADSEGRPGPYAYGKNHADGANMLAEAVEPYGGLIIWRCFVYDCQQDWRDTTTDRAKAGYDHYMPLDGCFKDNVVLEIKNGPMDFQVREPVSPLLGGLRKTQMLLEVQIAQEYTGQQRHVCYLLPWFRQILDQDMCCDETPSKVSDLIKGIRCGKPLGGIAAIANTGNDPNWTGHDLAAANFYGIGRLSFDTSLSPEAIAREWIRLTFGANKKAEDVLTEILLASWPAYEKYNAPLGIGWMCNPGYHYGPNPDGYEYDRWGTYHKADRTAIGIDRTRTGTGYTLQYSPRLCSLYEDRQTCPDELILFFHRLPYDYKLKSGKTVLQHIYDTHFEGAEEAAGFLAKIESIAGELPEDAYERMHQRFMHQKEHAALWRDVINTYFFRLTGIPDAHGRKIYP